MYSCFVLDEQAIALSFLLLCTLEPQIELDPSLEKGKIVKHEDEKEKGFPNTPSGGKFDRPWGMGGFNLDPEHKSNPFKPKAMQ